MFKSLETWVVAQFDDVFVLSLEQLDSSEKLPVMVYIHGGAYLIGGAEKYPPYAFLVEDVVLVVIQYRVGFFGESLKLFVCDYLHYINENQ